MSSPKPSFWCRAQQALPSFSHCSGQMVRCNFALQSMAVCSFPELKGGNQVDVTRTEIRRFWQDPCPEWSYVNTALQDVHTKAFCHLRIFSPWVQGNPVWDRINISLLCILPFTPSIALLHSLQLYLSGIYTVLHFRHHTVSSPKWWHPMLPSTPKLHM